MEIISFSYNTIIEQSTVQKFQEIVNDNFCKNISVNHIRVTAHFIQFSIKAESMWQRSQTAVIA